MKRGALAVVVLAIAAFVYVEVAFVDHVGPAANDLTPVGVDITAHPRITPRPVTP